MRNTWLGYDAIAGIYEYDMGYNMRFDDIGYYVRHATELAGEVLELGCGTGRVALALVRGGLTVTAVDASTGMLQRLRHSHASLPPEVAKRLRIVQMDVRRWALRGKFRAVLCPYSLFTYFVEPREYSSVLENVRASVLDGGQFLCDVFIPNRNIPFGQEMDDYQRPLPDGSVLIRSKVVAPAEMEGVHIITRHYKRVRGQDLQDRFTTTERIRIWEPDALGALLEQHSFAILARDLDYSSSRDQTAAQFVTFRCQPRG